MSNIDTKILSMIADRALALYARQGITESKLNVFMDLEYVDEIIPLDFDLLASFPDGDFAHDMNGIYKHWDRANKKMDNCFAPRCSRTGHPLRGGDPLPKPVDPTRQETPDGIVTMIDDNVDDGYIVNVEFNGHVERYDFDDSVEQANAVEWSIEAFRKNAPPDVFPSPVPTVDEQFDRSRAINLYLMAARDLGTNLGGYDLVDLLADKTDWTLDKCRRLANMVVSDPTVVDLLTTERVPKDIPPTLAPPKAPCSHIAAIVTLVHTETGEQVKGEYHGEGRYALVAQAYADLTGAGQWDEGQAYKVLDYFGWTDGTPLWSCPKCDTKQANVLRCSNCGHHNSDRADLADAPDLTRETDYVGSHALEPKDGG